MFAAPISARLLPTTNSHDSIKYFPMLVALMSLFIFYPPFLVPTSAPKNLKCAAISSTQLKIEWDQINTSNWNGNSDGYMIRYREFIPASTWLNTTSVDVN